MYEFLIKIFQILTKNFRLWIKINVLTDVILLEKIYVRMGNHYNIV